MVKLVEMLKRTFTLEDGFQLREIVINPEHIVCLREDEESTEEFKRMLEGDERKAQGLHSGCTFTKLTLNRGNMGSEIIVIGTVSEIHGKVNQSKNLLKG